MQLGRKIREIRKNVKMSLSELAKNTGVQIATLSRIEHGKMTGTISCHRKIAEALGIDVSELYDAVLMDERAERVHIDPIPKIFTHNIGASYEILSDMISNKRLLPMVIKLDGSVKTNEDQQKVGTEKFLFVLDGKIELQIDKNVMPLNRHQSIIFDAAKPHAIKNLQKTPAKILTVSTPVNL